MTGEEWLIKNRRPVVAGDPINTMHVDPLPMSTSIALDGKMTAQQISDEIWAAVVFIVDYGSIEIGTPQSKRLIAAQVALASIVGAKPSVPHDYPSRPNR